MPAFYETESEPRWWLGLLGRVLLLFVIVSLLCAAIWGIGVLISGPKGAGDAKKINNSAVNRIGAQERFQQQYQDFNADVNKIGLAKVTLSDDLKDPATRIAPPGGTSQYDFDRQNLTGLRSVCLSVVGDYNANAFKYSQQDWRSTNLPQQLAPTDCQ